VLFRSEGPRERGTESGPAAEDDHDVTPTRLRCGIRDWMCHAPRMSVAVLDRIAVPVFLPRMPGAESPADVTTGGPWSTGGPVRWTSLDCLDELLRQRSLPITLSGGHGRRPVGHQRKPQSGGPPAESGSRTIAGPVRSGVPAGSPARDDVQMLGLVPWCPLRTTA